MSDATHELESVEVGDSFMYEAFISYRHLPKDTAVAKRVQRAIEDFSIPVALRQEAGRPKLGKTFRDEDELPAGGALSEQIKEALRISRALIVVCSPETPKSTWVSAEIETFISLHGRESVFVVLADGEPVESFPNVLYESSSSALPMDANTITSDEPVAADFREGKTARQYRIEAARIRAALIGCRPDDLIQRQKTRIMQRAVVGGLCVAVALGAFGMFAFAQHVSIEQANRENLIIQSEQYAADAHASLESGDRKSAIRSALQSVDAAEQAGISTASAHVMLAESLGMYPAASGFQSCYTKEGIQDIGSNLAVSPTGGWFALCESLEDISICDIATGDEIATLDSAALEDALGEASDGSFLDSMHAYGDVLICMTESADLACFDAGSGELRWAKTKEEVGYLWDMQEAPDCKTIGMLSLVADKAFSLLMVDMHTGEVKDEYPLDIALGTGQFLAFDDKGARAAIVSGCDVVLVDLGNGASATVQAASEMVTDVAFGGDALCVTSSPADETESIKVGASEEALETRSPSTRVTIEAFDCETLELIWSDEREWEAYSGDSSTNPVALESRVSAFEAAGASLFLVTAGNDAFAYVTDDGSSTPLLEGDTPIVAYDIDDRDGALTIRAWSFDGACTEVKFPIASDSLFRTCSLGGFAEDVWAVYPARVQGDMYAVGLAAENREKALVTKYVDASNSPDSVFIGNDRGGSISLNCDESRVAWQSQDGVLMVTDTATLESEPVVNCEELGIKSWEIDNTSMAFSQTDPRVVYLRDKGSESAPPHIWALDVVTDDILGSWTWEYAREGDDFEECTISDERNGSFVVRIPAYGYIGVVDAASLETTIEFTATNEVPLADIVPLPERGMLASYAGGDVRLYDETLALLGDGLDGASVADADSLGEFTAVSPDGNLVFVACDDGILRALSIQDGSCVWSAEFDSTAGCLLSSSPDGSYLFAQSSDGVCVFFDKETGVRLTSSESLSTIGDVKYSESCDKVFLLLLDGRLNPRTTVLSLGAGDASGSASSELSASGEQGRQAMTCEIECEIGGGRAVSSKNGLVFAQGDNEIWCMPYYSLDDLKSLASQA
ncbi:toll/interleukin-1 receptor domain-containing protein [uncultured Slackia sp.]|uniref:toll/interleukin-1 receptor domain-containing protein n=1 Tax=uncultured Slackia sp. TaxID=665903 RepID=UPI002600DACE|nr:toll/interleukin-1 receptor domain-containing protein [uncultured Slackia sp.]